MTVPVNDRTVLGLLVLAFLLVVIVTYMPQP